MNLKNIRYYVGSGYLRQALEKHGELSPAERDWIVNVVIDRLDTRRRR